ncbi:alcohol oxidase [Mollisia scopiformis]|uniref:Alcohol oxidase n=1 Tax=Mollisia scopiformis TaxID=149040 RepID=A0A194XKS2_MOLSC|nr:alcohol oxidase [Mollisia scopiformis]KUJ20830.1 alcohol oxidase [Mollisia scopiformis]
MRLKVWLSFPFVFTGVAASELCLDRYDYIVVGGGPGGLTVANRLSEVSGISVAVIEAGREVFNNPNVTSVDGFTTALNTAIDWQYISTNQSYASGQTLAYHAGKALGGTSTINGMTYVRAEKSQIDSWGAIGNAGWSWDDLFSYYKKSESLTLPTAAQLSSGVTFVPNDHGESGPLKVGYPYGLLNGSFHTVVENTWQALDLPHNPDVNGGSVRGYTIWQSTLDMVANVREDAARAYYYPVELRPNLHVFLNTTVNRIVWGNSDGAAVASGVEITFSNGSISILKSRREVILSAGSLRSPAILELSGIGNPSILDKYGIGVKVDLPGVGENLQDQPNNNFISSTNSTFNGSIVYVAYGSMPDFFDDWDANINISSYAESVSAAINNTIAAASLEYLFGIQYKLLQNGIPNAETIMETTLNLGLGPNGLLVSPFWLLMPFSRGNVHISSRDPKVYPTINPNFFLVDFDLKVQMALAKWTRKFLATEPMKSLITAEVSPGFTALPENATDAEWESWVKTAFSSNSHPLGTAAMMPRKLGGVVDGKLKVYGTENVRVVDASVMPFQVSGHLTSTIYAIAEKASDMIKEAM